MANFFKKIMTILPLLEKNAFLKIFISGDYIYSQLFYSHYNIGRSYALNSSELSLVNKDIFNDEEFWKEYLISIEKELEWKILSDEGGVYTVKEFFEEGEGVSGIHVIVDAERNLYESIFDGVRKFSPLINIKKVDEDTVINTLKLFSKKYKYNDVIFLDLSLNRTSLIRLKQKGIEKNLNPLVTQYDVITAKRKIEEVEILEDLINDGRLRAFMDEEISSSVFSNNWINFIKSGRKKSKNVFIVDLCRALTTIQLLSLFNQDNNISYDFGKQNKYDSTVLGGNALIVTGDFAEFVNSKDLYISIVDGLHLNGHFDIYIDEKRYFHTYLPSYLLGTNSSDIILTKENVLLDPDKVLVVDFIKQKEKRNVMISGSFINNSSGKVPFHSLSPLINSYIVPDEKTIYEINLLKCSKIGNITEKIGFISDPLKIKYKNLIIDLRIKPITYGPDARTNKLNKAMWFNE